MRPVIVEFPDFGVKQWEYAVFCPKCAKSNVTRDSLPCGAGSGPGGSHRLGDDYRPRITCNACGHVSIGKLHTWIDGGHFKGAYSMEVGS